jgi:TRAP-type C4-dicarboxylate transport system substrate-binding protein
MKRIFVCFLAIMGLFSFSGCSKKEAPKTESASKYVLSFSNFMPAGGAYEKQIVEVMNDLLKERSDGRLSLEIYSGGSLAQAPDTVDAVASGLADIGITYTSTMPGRYPVSSLCEMPFVVSSAQAATYAYREAMEKWQPEELKGVKILMYYAAGPGVVMTKRSLATPSNLSGFQVRTNSTLALSVSALGGTPVTMAMGEIYEALRTGVVDAYIGAIETVGAYKFWEVAPKIAFYPLLNTSHLMVMNQTTYDALPDDLKKILDEVTEEVWKNNITHYFDDAGLVGIEMAREDKAEINLITQDEIDVMISKCDSIISNYVSELNALGFDGEAMAKEWREITNKYNALYPYPSPIFY